MSASKTTVVAVLVLLVTFAAGICVGVFGAHLAILHGGRGPAFPPAIAMVNRLDRRLDLTPAQRTQVEQIIRRHHASISAIWSGLHPQVRKELAEANDEISRILTPEQRRKFEAMKLHLGDRTHAP